MEIHAYPGPDCLIIEVGESRIDAACAILFKDSMRALSRGAQGRVVLDLRRVTFIDSSGLGAIVAAMKQLAPHCTLELANPTAAVTKVFRLTRMDTVFTIHHGFSPAAPAELEEPSSAPGDQPDEAGPHAVQ